MLHSSRSWCPSNFQCFTMLVVLLLRPPFEFVVKAKTNDTFSTLFQSGHHEVSQIQRWWPSTVCVLQDIKQITVVPAPFFAPNGLHLSEHTLLRSKHIAECGRQNIRPHCPYSCPDAHDHHSWKTLNKFSTLIQCWLSICNLGFCFLFNVVLKISFVYLKGKNFKYI